MKIFWAMCKNQSFSAKNAQLFLTCVFAVFHTPAVVSCKECVFDRRRNYCIFLLILRSSLQHVACEWDCVKHTMVTV